MRAKIFEEVICRGDLIDIHLHDVGDRACEDEFGEDWCANFVPAFLKSRARAAGKLKARLLHEDWFSWSKVQKASFVKTEVLLGITICFAQVPESVAFSFVAGVPPLVGLYSTFFLGFITAVIGGKEGMISGAAGAMAVYETYLCPQCLAAYLRDVYDELRDRFALASILDGGDDPRGFLRFLACAGAPVAFREVGDTTTLADPGVVSAIAEGAADNDED